MDTFGKWGPWPLCSPSGFAAYAEVKTCATPQKQYLLGDGSTTYYASATASRAALYHRLLATSIGSHSVDQSPPVDQSVRSPHTALTATPVSIIKLSIVVIIIVIISSRSR